MSIKKNNFEYIHKTTVFKSEGSQIMRFEVRIMCGLACTNIIQLYYFGDYVLGINDHIFVRILFQLKP